MRILIPSVVDLRKTAPNRLHYFIRYLSRKHEIAAICINDWWKSELVNMNEHYKDFREALDSIEIQYITPKRMSPVIQELLSPMLLSIPRNDFNIILNYNTLISGYYVARKLKLPTVYDLADDLPAMIASSPQIPRFLRLPGKWFGEIMLKINIAISKKVTFITSSLKDSYNIPEDKCQLIPNGVDINLFRYSPAVELKKKLSIEDGSFVVGYTGVLREWVDLEPVFSMARRLGEDIPKLKVLVVGGEGELQGNKDLTAKYSVSDKSLFTGTVPYNQIPQYISCMDVCLIPFKLNAVAQNSLPMKLFEYMACEKPVISTSLAGVKEAVGDRVLYFSNTDELATVVTNIYNNEGLRQKMGLAGREFVKEHYSWETICSRLEAVLLEVASVKPRKY